MISMEFETIIKKLHLLENQDNIKGMARYGINQKNNLGITIYQLRSLAKEIGNNHALALRLWDSQIHDARLLACFIDNPSKVTEDQMDTWARDFDSWDICDQVCTSLFDRSPFSYKKVFQWASYEEEFVKRAAFSLIAGLAVHDKSMTDKEFECFLPLLIQHAVDERNYVKKAINWALRNIGKRNFYLNKVAIKTANEMQKIDSKSARWIASDAIRELTNQKVNQMLKRKKKKINVSL